MPFFRKRSPALLLIFTSVVFTPFQAVYPQSSQSVAEVRKEEPAKAVSPLPVNNLGVNPSATVSPVIAQYYDAAQGSSSNDLVRRALSLNQEFQAVRLDIERARARLTQSGLRPNPSVDFEQTTGRLAGSPGEREISVGFALPIELGGKRQRRIDLARAELEAVEAELADRERRLISETRLAYAEALASLRELQITENLNTIDTQVARVIEARVTEGDSSPLELNLVRVEVDRLRARRAIVEGRLQAAILKLKTIAGIPQEEPLRLQEDLANVLLPEPTLPVEEAITVALKNRPDARFARLQEVAAQAGLRLARSQATPDLTAFSKYTMNRSLFDDTPVGVLRDKDKLLSFGISISLPFFNRNQGAKAEAEIAIEQARRRREFMEATVRSEVAAAYAKYHAARNALAIFEKGVIERSSQNVESLRRAYELGAFRVTDLLTEQRKMVDSQREFIEALTERYRALAEIQSAIGVGVNK